jgi:hypothetical protein
MDIIDIKILIKTLINKIASRLTDITDIRNKKFRIILVTKFNIKKIINHIIILK